MADGFQRAINAASESRRTISGRPYKPWRVFGAGEHYEDRRSQPAAYALVAAVTADGATATVWHWEEGRWVKYEVIDPDAED
jgi:hypothetical protein